MLSKVSSEHHYFEIAAKRAWPGFRTTMKGFTFFLLAITCRMPSALFIILNYRKYAALVFLVIAFCSFVAYCRIFGRNVVKNFWTALSSVLIPACFVCKDDVMVMQNPRRQFIRFYAINATIFHVIGLLAQVPALLVAVGLWDQAESFFNENFKQIPFYNDKQTLGNLWLMPSASLSAFILELLVLFFFGYQEIIHKRPTKYLSAI